MPVFKVTVEKIQQWELLIEAPDEKTAKQQAHDQIRRTPTYFTPVAASIIVDMAELYPFTNKDRA